MKYLTAVNEVPRSRAVLYDAITDEFLNSGLNAAQINDARGVIVEGLRNFCHRRELPIRVVRAEMQIFLERTDRS